MLLQQQQQRVGASDGRGGCVPAQRRQPGRRLRPPAVASQLASEQPQQPQQQAAAEVRPQAARADMQAQRTRLRLSRRQRGISWWRYEQALYGRMVELQQEQALLSPSPEAADRHYYSFWDAPDAHLPALQDQGYQAAWAAAVRAAAPLLSGKVVLDVGCGLGTLSMLAARAGAKHVFAIDASAGAADMARRVVAANGLSGRVTVICGRAEAVTLPVRQVDAIISDWMGAMLLHESLLPAVIRARDRWLAPGGVILPDAARLHVQALDDKEYLSSQAALWGGRTLGPPAGAEGGATGGAMGGAKASGGGGGGGFDLRPVLGSVVTHPRVDSPVRRSALVTPPQQLLALDLYKARLQDMSFSRPFALTAPQRPERASVSGLLLWWDVAFTCRGQLQQQQQQQQQQQAGSVTFSTGPLAPATSWLQVVCSFPRALTMQAGQQLRGTLRCAPAPGLPQGRALDVDVDVELEGMRARIAYQLKR